MQCTQGRYRTHADPKRYAYSDVSFTTGTYPGIGYNVMTGINLDARRHNGHYVLLIIPGKRVEGYSNCVFAGRY